MHIDKKAIGQRLKQFLIQKFGSVNAGAEALGTTASTLSGTYFSGKSMLGGELLLRLIELGCDITWLSTGKTLAGKLQEENDRLKAEITVLRQSEDKITEMVKTNIKNTEGMLQEVVDRFSKSPPANKIKRLEDELAELKRQLTEAREENERLRNSLGAAAIVSQAIKNKDSKYKKT